MKIVFAVSECTPFIKTGGLADVGGELPRAYAALGHEVHVFLPRYSQIADLGFSRGPVISVQLGWRRQRARVDGYEADGVSYHFISNDFYFDRPYIYGAGYEDGERFAFFSKAVLESLPVLGIVPDMIHSNDWQTGMIPALVRLQYPRYAATKLLFTIHNLKFQGLFPFPDADDWLTLGGDLFTPEKLEFYGLCSYLKAGILYADTVTTVSPTYAEEIKTEYFGERMDGVLRAVDSKLVGIVNGVGGPSPENDPDIAARYSAADPSGKAVCKTALQRELGLDPSVPVVAMITRLTEQKGLPLVRRVFDELMALNVSFVLLGSGDREFEDFFRDAAARCPHRVAVRFGMDEPLARRIYAGADMFLMPSRFEPCGISQLLALRYGAVPIVRETGGLKDTVPPCDSAASVGVGFTFKSYNAHDMLAAVAAARRAYDDAAAWSALIKRGMEADHGWEPSARAYLGLV